MKKRKGPLNVRLMKQITPACSYKYHSKPISVVKVSDCSIGMENIREGEYMNGADYMFAGTAELTIPNGEDQSTSHYSIEGYFKESDDGKVKMVGDIEIKNKL